MAEPHPARSHRPRVGLALAMFALSTMVVSGVMTESASAEPPPAGMDVASHQRNVDWAHWWGQGKRFVFVKATEGTGYRNPYHGQQYNGSFDVGMIRGAYHFALPNRASGEDQANFFVDNGGGWSADGKTLPGALDIEYNPYSGNTCYNMSHAAMVAWIHAFTRTYKARTGRDAVIYTTTNWWVTCTGNSPEFGANPLWIARYNSQVGTLPASWNTHTFWQFTSTPLDQNTFNGSFDRLVALAKGSQNAAPPPPPPAPPAPPVAKPGEKKSSPATSASRSRSASPSRDGSGGGLPKTGADATLAAATGVGLVGLGAVLLVVAQRRRAYRAAHAGPARGMHAGEG